MESLPQWFDDPDEMHEFARYLVDTGDLDKVGDVLDYFEKPWKWDPERAEFLKLRAAGDWPF